MILDGALTPLLFHSHPMDLFSNFDNNLHNNLFFILACLTCSSSRHSPDIPVHHTVPKELYASRNTKNHKYIKNFITLSLLDAIKLLNASMQRCIQH